MVHRCALTAMWSRSRLWVARRSRAAALRRAAPRPLAARTAAAHSTQRRTAPAQPERRGGANHSDYLTTSDNTYLNDTLTFCSRNWTKISRLQIIVLR